MLLGLGSCLVCAVLFGSVFVPIKSFNTGDGIMTQLFMCLGAYVVSLVVHFIQGFPPLYPLAVMGGSIWCIANATAIPIMNQIGMALGILVWNSLSCLTGWATSRFGFFGLPAAVPASPLLNYAGVLLLIVGGTLYLFIKSNTDDENEKYDIEKNGNAPDTVDNGADKKAFVIRIVCFGAAMIAGMAYGSMITPITYMQSYPEKFGDAPTTGLPYTFSFFTGVAVTSSIIVAVYCAVKRNRPMVNTSAILPGFACGLIFGLAFAFFLLANQLLSQAIAYPICAMAPGIVASAWSVFYFKEITGRRNLMFLGVAYAFTIAGVAMVTISRD